MKLYLASFLQKKNFGPGTIISIAQGNKPRDLNVDKIFLPFMPKQTLLEQYYQEREINPKLAGEKFVSSYESQLQTFVDEVLNDAKEANLTPQELLPFKEGDTLCSWERAEYTNYRKILVNYLRKLGYEVISN